MSMLDPAVHSRILQDLPGVCSRAGVSERFLHESAKVFCGQAEIDWLVGFHQNGRPGLKLIGANGVERCMALAGALLRNFVDARVRTVDELVEDPVDASVLLCPNFCMPGSSKDFPAWKQQKVYDQLITRYRADQPTVIWISSEEDLKSWSAPIRDLLSKYKTAKV